MTFPRCARCGLVAGVACTCALAIAHPESLCGQFDRDGVYCALSPAEQPHGPHRDGPIQFISTLSITVSSSTSSLGWGTIPHQPVIWRIGKG
jgi:hypothetical protein